MFSRYPTLAVSALNRAPT